MDVGYNLRSQCQILVSVYYMVNDFSIKSVCQQTDWSNTIMVNKFSCAFVTFYL